MYHVLSVFLLIISMMIVTFSGDNPLIVVSSLIWCIIQLVRGKDYKNLKLGIILMIPMILVTGIVNVITVNAGNRILFTIFGKVITLEILLYVLVSSMKLLVIIYLFNILNNLLDTDKAVSYFSKRCPRVTLVVLLSLKLIPNMKRRVQSLKNTYIIRGSNLESSSKKESIKAYIPILSILLEDSLEKSFDIGESAYVRGFGGGKRSEYEKSKLQFRDYVIIFYFLFISIIHIILLVIGKTTYDIYEGSGILSFMNVYSILEMAIILVSLLLLNKRYN